MIARLSLFLGILVLFALPVSADNSVQINSTVDEIYVQEGWLSIGEQVVFIVTQDSRRFLQTEFVDINGDLFEPARLKVGMRVVATARRDTLGRLKLLGLQCLDPLE